MQFLTGAAVLLFSLGLCQAQNQAEGSQEIPLPSNLNFHPSRVLVKMQGTRGPDSYTTQPVRPGESIEEAVLRLQRQPGVAYAEPDWLIEGQGQPNDPEFHEQWGLVSANADCAWHKMADITTSSVPVCVVDSGIEYDHNDLKEHMHPTYRTGWNAISKTDDARDDLGHGTHVAGIIAATANNSIGVAGISATAQLIPCKFLNSNNQGYVSDAVACIDYCHYTAGAKISSHSWGTLSTSTLLSDKIKEVTALGHILIAAAGNSAVDNDVKRNSPMYPASFTHAGIISVAALAADETLAGYSNYGATSVDLAAPGSGIMSSHVGGTYNSGSGTSFSAPFVTGAVALLAAVKPDITPTEIKAVLLATANKLPSLTGKCVSGGALDLCAAVESVIESMGDPDLGDPSPQTYPPPLTWPSPPPPPFAKKRPGRRLLLDLVDDNDTIAWSINLRLTLGL